MKKNTKKTLLFSVLALILCCAMLIGTTFAWFTDSASTAVNKIQAGTLQIGLEMKQGDTWVNAEGETLGWVTVDNREQDQIFWEPGCTYQLPELRIVNKGNLALKCKIIVSGIVGDAELLDALYFTCGENGGNEIAIDDIGAEVSLAPEATKEGIIIKGHMKEEAGNEYQGLSIEGIGITVIATQDDVEYDSFNNTYDANAAYPVTVTSSEEAQSSIMTNKTTAAGEKNVNVVASSNITLDLDASGGFYNATLGGTDSETVSIDAGGNKITFDSDYRNAINCYGKLTISNATLDSTYKTEGSTWDDYALIFRHQDSGANEVVFNNVTFNRQVAIEKGVKATFNNCTIDQTAATGDMYALWIQAGADVTLNNCTIKSVNPNSGNLNRAIKIADEYVDDPQVTNLTVNGTTITSQKKAAVLVTSTAGANITWGTGNDISGVAADTVNAVWNDSDRTAAWNLVTVTGCTKYQET